MPNGIIAVEVSSGTPSIRPGRCEAIPVNMCDDAAVAAFGEQFVAQGIVLNGVVMMPPQMPPTNDCLPPNDTWRTLFQRSFIGPLGLGGTLTPDYMASLQRRAEQEGVTVTLDRQDLEHSAGQVRYARRSSSGRRAAARCILGSHDRRELATDGGFTRAY